MRKKGCRERRGMGSHCEQADLGEEACGEHYKPPHLTNLPEKPHPPSLHLELEFGLSKMQRLETGLKAVRGRAGTVPGSLLTRR